MALYELVRNVCIIQSEKAELRHLLLARSLKNDLDLHRGEHFDCLATKQTSLYRVLVAGTGNIPSRPLLGLLRFILGEWANAGNDCFQDPLGNIGRDSSLL